MLSSNFYYRINYQIKNGAIYPVFIKFINDRLMHPFLSAKKKFFRKKHQDYLKLKKTSTDYFSINAYYWNSILNNNFKKCVRRVYKKCLSNTRFQYKIVAI